MAKPHHSRSHDPPGSSKATRTRAKPSPWQSWSVWIRTSCIVVVFLAMCIRFVFRHPTLLHGIDKTLTWMSATSNQKQLQNNFFLSGNFAPVTDEHIGVALQVVQGAIPPDLNGLFVRNGPNPIREQMTKPYHWFDGHGMLHNVRIQNGSATYTNQYIPTPRYRIERQFQADVFPVIHDFKGWSGLFRILAIVPHLARAFGLTDLTVSQANTHTIMYRNMFLCGYEVNLPFEIELGDDGRIVRAVGFQDFGGQLNYPVSAHPKIDFDSNTLLFHAYTPQPHLVQRDGPIKVGEYDGASGKLLSYFGVVPSQDRHVPFAHDLLFTKNWIIVFDSSVHFDEMKLFASADFFTFQNDTTLRIGLVPRVKKEAALDDNKDNQTGNTITSKDVVWIDTLAPHVVVHGLTSWEEDDGTVVIWTPLGNDFDMALVERNVYHMTELRMNPHTGKLISKRVIDTKHNVEFPRVRDDCMGRSCRFGYSMLTVDGFVFVGFIVWDMEQGQVHQVVHYPDGYAGGEAVVIPKPGRLESNAVYLGTFLYDEVGKESYFVLYDGEDDHGLVVMLRVPYRVPFGLHGQWVAWTELQAHIAYHHHETAK